MRRLLPFAAFALVLAIPVWAQHGGGHAGGHSGGFSGHGGFTGRGGGGGHTFGGMRGPGVSRGFTHAPTFSQRSFSQRHFGNDGFRGHRFHTHGFRNNCFGFNCRNRFFFPYAYAGYYPYWWWDSGSSYDEDYERDRALANEMNRESLEEQRMRRQEEADGDQDSYSRSAPRDPETATAQPPTVLIFRDLHRREVQNYAIVGQTLWAFASPHTEKIPLADLDLAATTKANDERGLTFRVPAFAEAQ